MAKGEVKMTMDMLHNLFSLCDVQCFATNCRYHQEGSLYCNLKQITIGSKGTCMLFDEEVK